MLGPGLALALKRRTFLECCSAPGGVGRWTARVSLQGQASRCLGRILDFADPCPHTNCNLPRRGRPILARPLAFFGLPILNPDGSEQSSSHRTWSSPGCETGCTAGYKSKVVRRLDDRARGLARSKVVLAITR